MDLNGSKIDYLAQKSVNYGKFENRNFSDYDTSTGLKNGLKSYRKNKSIDIASKKVFNNRYILKN